VWARSQALLWYKRLLLGVYLWCFRSDPRMEAVAATVAVAPIHEGSGRKRKLRKDDAVSSGYLVYLLLAEDKTRSYVGLTNNLAKRLRQHNQEIKGGARYTRGKAWRLVLAIRGFASDRCARQLEWRLHRYGRCNRRSGKDVLEKRVRHLCDAMNMERWTSTCKRTSEMNLTFSWTLPEDARLFDDTEAYRWPTGVVTHVVAAQVN
jgi:putative endonuclease